MSVALQKNVNITEFEAFLQSAEGEKRYELIDGEILEMPSNSFASEIASLINFFLRLFLREQGLKGHVTGEGGGYIINGQIIAPDVAYLSHERQAQLDREGFNQVPPQLAVEVLSDPSSNAEQTALRRKLVHYRAAGVTVWVVDYLAQLVEVHTPDGAMQVYEHDATLSGSDFLPEFELAVQDIFPES